MTQKQLDLLLFIAEIAKDRSASTWEVNQMVSLINNVKSEYESQAKE